MPVEASQLECFDYEKYRKEVAYPKVLTSSLQYSPALFRTRYQVPGTRYLSHSRTLHILSVERKK